MLKHLVKRLRKPKLFDVIMYEGRYYTVVEIEWPGEIVTLQPLMETIARTMIVEGKNKEYITLYDALREDGWTPPNAQDK